MTDCSQGLEKCEFTLSINFEIKDGEGKVVDKLMYDNMVGMSYYEAVALKYAHLNAMSGGGQKALLGVAAGKTLTEVLQEG